MTLRGLPKSEPSSKHHGVESNSVWTGIHRVHWHKRFNNTSNHVCAALQARQNSIQQNGIQRIKHPPGRNDYGKPPNLQLIRRQVLLQKIRTCDGPAVSSFMEWGPIFCQCWRQLTFAGCPGSIYKNLVHWKCCILKSHWAYFLPLGGRSKHQFCQLLSKAGRIPIIF